MRQRLVSKSVTAGRERCSSVILLTCCFLFRGDLRALLACALVAQYLEIGEELPRIGFFLPVV